MMEAKFSRNEIIEMAIQIERRGLSFFEAMQKSAKGNNVKKVFEFLANEEKEHIATFEELRSSTDRLQIQGAYNWEEVGLYFRALVDTKVFPEVEEGAKLVKELPDELAVIQMAIAIEKNNILFFRERCDLVWEGDEKLLGELIEQEKGHICRLLHLEKELETP